MRTRETERRLAFDRDGEEQWCGESRKDLVVSFPMLESMAENRRVYENQSTA